ncbi:hypothetical protein HF086_001279 [Spodoptera exigua]|uniref:Uncharacterized protein n=1 Tax=Spodoptera exigua TaxID=7107 RepID=A0A922MBX7_SPOEX|nr:hypothetical protein HF086_001279 [Spodoptera exigua]
MKVAYRGQYEAEVGRLATGEQNREATGNKARERPIGLKSLINDVIRKTLIEVAETGRWQSITNAVELLKQSECDVESLKVTNQRLKTTRKALAAELNAKRNQWALELRNADQKVAVLRDKMSVRI